ncbi:MAG: phosphate transport system regulatory protein PhoU [Gammaproteobacteria bacterium]|nr:MAG: phosphate transport system regulatory protein PhoU [Pseudomonadota bacterium]PIE38769.1 MAG: phosphate transport system regulatory protein PhoU [Gammaproteobacteria bacterium]
MSHYEERLVKDLKEIRHAVAIISQDVEKAVENAIHAMLSGDDQLANAITIEDKPINRKVRALDKKCNAFIAKHLPSASHLRLISSVLRTNVALERIGDYAVTIARVSIQRSEPPTGAVAHDIELMGTESRQMLRQACSAFIENNADRANATTLVADQVERQLANALDNLAASAADRNAEDIRSIFGLYGVLNKIERISDQAKNICEEAVFVATGRPKEEKVYRILFLDKDNTCQSLLAESIGKKLFPESGIFESAGARADDVMPEVRQFMETRGLHQTSDPRSTSSILQLELDNFHLVISLQGPVSDYYPSLPFHTAALEWHVEQLAVGLDQAQTEACLENIYRSISSHIQGLMETLRGDEAN